MVPPLFAPPSTGVVFTGADATGATVAGFATGCGADASGCMTDEVVCVDGNKGFAVKEVVGVVCPPMLKEGEVSKPP
jgi:hypothetical protein